MKRDKFYQYSDDETLYEELLDQAGMKDEEVMEANIDELLLLIAWQDRIENRDFISTEGKNFNFPSEEQIKLAMKKNWKTDNTLN